MVWNFDGNGASRLGLGSKLNFGKYKGETVELVLRLDPTYLDWCLDNVDGFAERMDDELMDDVRLAADEERQRDSRDGDGTW